MIVPDRDLYCVWLDARCSAASCPNSPDSCIRVATRDRRGAAGAILSTAALYGAAAATWNATGRKAFPSTIAERNSARSTGRHARPCHSKCSAAWPAGFASVGRTPGLARFAIPSTFSRVGDAVASPAGIPRGSGLRRSGAAA